MCLLLRTLVNTGGVAIIATGNFNIKTVTEVNQGIHAKYSKVLQHGDGYNYRLGAAFAPKAKASGIHVEIR